MVEVFSAGGGFPPMKPEEIKSTIQSAKGRPVRWVDMEGIVTTSISLGADQLPPLVALQEKAESGTITRYLPALGISYVEPLE